MSRTLWPALLTLLVATPAQAQIARPDGWVAADGRIVRPGDAPPPPGAVHPATRSDWVGECEHRLNAANGQADVPGRFEPVCRAWLDYYERTGATRQGYDFDYAIPVSVTTIEVPGHCPPPTARPSPPPIPRPAPAPAKDKRQPIIRY